MADAAAGPAEPRWPDEIFQVLRQHAVIQVGYVPDAGHARLIRRCSDDPAVTAVPLTTEEEGVALIAGADLGGQRAALLMQSSGVGNCVNLFSLLSSCGFPALLLVTMRGEWGETNPWQVPMARQTRSVLESSGFTVHRADRPEEAAETVAAAATLAFGGGQRAAVLLGQRLIGAKVF
jgi:sulfopyruvate decarboxylase alpha subunit